MASGEELQARYAEWVDAVLAAGEVIVADPGSLAEELRERS
jgi:hypothetical protein